MAKLHIQEYTSLGIDARGFIAPIGVEPATNQAFTYNTTTQSNAFASATKFVRVIADADVYLKFGDNPTATNNDLYLPSGVAEFFAVKGTIKVAAYDGTS